MNIKILLDFIKGPGVFYYVKQFRILVANEIELLITNEIELLITNEIKLLIPLSELFLQWIISTAVIVELRIYQ